ncbi:MAG: hypothetical protein RL199_785 [Pseudomonadota bacterium]|jgi:hypothetical protein
MHAEPTSILFADVEALRSVLDTAGVGVAELGARLAAYTRGAGRFLGGSLYGALTADEMRALRHVGCDGVLTHEEGDGSAPESVALLLDAARSLHEPAAPDVVVLATDDAQAAELVRRFRRRGSHVVAVVPEVLAAAQPALSADRVLVLEQLLHGDVAPELMAPRLREAPPRVLPASFDLAAFDWSRLVLLLRDLEARMPFVGMRWLKNKVLGPHNVGVTHMGDKQALLNKAVDEGMVEVFRVGNREEGGEPVTACRLVRDNARVSEILAAHPTPEPAPAQDATGTSDA